MTGFVGITRLHTLAVGLALVLGLAACGSGKGAATASTATPSPASGEPASSGPPPSEWLSDLDADGSSLYLTSHSCPGQVAAGQCTLQSDFRLPTRIKPFPVTLWRYADGSWENLGEPGVFSTADMKVLAGGLMFVPRTDDGSSGGLPTGPLRVSLDEGKTWDDWQIPQQQRRCRRSGPCTLGVAGGYAVIASNFGWIRRNVSSRGWEDITPPKRAPIHDDDTVGYGLLVLEDGTLIATVNNITPGPGGYFRVSRDFGSTWSAPHSNPGKISEVDSVDGSTLYASCWKIDFVSSSGTGHSGCGRYRTTDLEHWTKATTADESGTCRRDLPLPGPDWRQTVSAVRVGELVYRITYVPYVKGHEATQKDLAHLDLPHRVRHILETSSDSCRTWEQVLNGTRP